MKTWFRPLILGSLGSCALLLGACNLDNRPPVVQPGSILLPLEVISPDDQPFSRTARFALREATGQEVLYIKGHRLGFKNPLNKTDRPKASVRLNGGDWIPLQNDTPGLTVLGLAREYGGIGGGFNTVELTLQHPALRFMAGVNEVEFRFNGTDGLSSGYRVLAFNVRRGGADLIPAETFKEDDPATWRPPLDNPADIEAGENLWYFKELRMGAGSKSPLRANCADCHDKEGHDLKYFNFSSWAIEARSRFHGLTEREGKQIASYIRSLDFPASKKGRPWNPPYQPGPGLDSQPVREWAAGAGLEAVLKSDRDLLPLLFPNGTDQAALNAAVNLEGNLNLRELPVALEMPDWLDWLPDPHPKDAWGSYFDTSEVNQAYLQTRRTLEQRGVESLIASNELLPLLNTLRATLDEQVGIMRGPDPCKVYRGVGGYTPQPSPLLDRLGNKEHCEKGLLSLNRWSAVKHWEIMQAWNLEDKNPQVYPGGEARGWPGQWRQVFEVPGHRSGNNSYNFVGFDRLLGVYDNASWYHLQLLLNPGNRQQKNLFPVEWSYVLQHLDFLHLESGNKNLKGSNPALLVASMIKLYQSMNRSSADENGWWMTVVHPWQLDYVQNWGRGSNLWLVLDQYEPGLRARVANAFLRAFLQKTRSFGMEQWQRLSDVNQRSLDTSDRLEHSDYTDLAWAARTDPQQNYYLEGKAIRFARVLERFSAMPGIDRALLRELFDWCKAVWPRANWDGLNVQF